MDRSRRRLTVIWECPVADNRRSSSDVATGMDGKSRIISGADARRCRVLARQFRWPKVLHVGSRAGVKGVVTCAIWIAKETSITDN